MKLTRLDAFSAYAGLQALEKGKDNRPFNLTWETWDKVFKMMLALENAAKAYDQTRKQRMLTMANGKAVLDDPRQQQLFAQEEEKVLGETISIRMPKQIEQDALNLKENRIPPTVLLQIKPLIAWKENEGDFDEDENDY